MRGTSALVLSHHSHPVPTQPHPHAHTTKTLESSVWIHALQKELFSLLVVPATVLVLYRYAVTMSGDTFVTTTGVPMTLTYCAHNLGTHQIVSLESLLKITCVVCKTCMHLIHVNVLIICMYLSIFCCNHWNMCLLKYTCNYCTSIVQYGEIYWAPYTMYMYIHIICTCTCTYTPVLRGWFRV